MNELEFKGTKGEWYVEPSELCFETTIKCGEIRIAEAKHYNNGTDDWTQFDPIDLEGKANAKLIASAPELLEALQELMRVYEDKGQLLSFNVNIARKAIEKALL